MKSDLDKKKAQLIEELERMRHKVSELEAYKTSYLASEKELRESEEKLRLMFESVSDGITVTDLDGIITYVNKAVLKLGRFDSEGDVVGTSAFESIAFRDRERALTDMLGLRQQDTVGAGQYDLLRADGSEYPAEISAGLLKDAAGSPVGFISVIRDIAGRKQAERSLWESEERYKNLVELAPDAIISVDENGIVTSCNLAFAKQSGYDKQELVGKYFTELPTMSSPDNTEAYNKLFAALSSGGELESFEFPWIHKDGTLRWGEVHATVMMADGQFKGAQAIMRDITERKWAEEVFRTISLRSPVGMYIVQDGKFVFANHQLLRDFSITEERLLSVKPLSRVRPEDREMVKQNAVEMLKGKRTTPYEYAVTNRRGVTRWFMETVVPIQYQGKRAVLGNLLNITERKQTEERLRESGRRFR